MKYSKEFCEKLGRVNEMAKELNELRQVVERRQAELENAMMVASKCQKQLGEVRAVMHAIEGRITSSMAELAAEGRSASTERMGMAERVVERMDLTLRAVLASRVTDEPPVESKYAVIRNMIAHLDFNISSAAIAVYGDDSERNRNRVHAALTHLKERDEIIKTPDGWRLNPNAPGLAEVTARIRAAALPSGMATPGRLPVGGRVKVEGGG